MKEKVPKFEKHGRIRRGLAEGEGPESKIFACLIQLTASRRKA
jgi:hypothetical protein